MAGIIENFKLDLADDYDIPFKESTELISILISVMQEEAPGRVARQKLVNAFARTIQTDFAKAVKAVEQVRENRAEYEKFLKDARSARAMRSMDRSMKKLQKFIDMMK